MRLGRKHENQTSVVYKDFTGGLNTAIAADGIAENQMAECVNLEIDHSTGQLKTVGGTRDIAAVQSGDIFAAAWDSINDRLLLVLSDRTVHDVRLPDAMIQSIGKLTGDLYPSYAAWENGVLIASGGKLQYYNGTELLTIDSPKATSVFVRGGRVLITDAANVYYSGVGDETNWTENSNDDSASKFVEAGYKDGGSFIGMASLSSDIMLIKSNRRVYRLSGEFPDWSISEVSRNVDCKGRMAFCSVADSVFILGHTEMQMLRTTEAYGDVMPQNMATLVEREIAQLPDATIVRHVPPLRQVWAIGEGGTVLVYDLAVNAWFLRKFNSQVLDVVSVKDKVYVVKRDRVSVITESTFFDEGEPLSWKFRARRLISQHEYLLKRSQVSIAPLTADLYSGYMRCGAVIVPLPLPAWRVRIWHNYSKIYKNHVRILLKGRNRGRYLKGELIYDNMEPIYGNKVKIFTVQTIIKESRNVFRSKFLDLRGRGEMGGFVLNHIIMDIAEV